MNHSKKPKKKRVEDERLSKLSRAERERMAKLSLEEQEAARRRTTEEREFEVRSKSRADAALYYYRVVTKDKVEAIEEMNRVNLSALNYDQLVEHLNKRVRLANMIREALQKNLTPKLALELAMKMGDSFSIQIRGAGPFYAKIAAIYSDDTISLQKADGEMTRTSFSEVVSIAAKVDCLLGLPKVCVGTRYTTHDGKYRGTVKEIYADDTIMGIDDDDKKLYLRKNIEDLSLFFPSGAVLPQKVGRLAISGDGKYVGKVTGVTTNGSVQIQDFDDNTNYIRNRPNFIFEIDSINGISKGDRVLSGGKYTGVADSFFEESKIRTRDDDDGRYYVRDATNVAKRLL